ncbi:MAG: hypothetical protein V3W34_01465 [Phycisphaerae bacterium]
MCAVGWAGCDVQTLLNQTATFGAGGSLVPAGAPIGSGGRGNFRVLIENNTPFRAIFTTGVFDNTDERSTPIFFQYSPDSRFIAANSTATLEGNANTGIITLPCGRVFSVGSRSLISLIDANAGALADDIDEAALVDGVGFSDADISAEEAAVPQEGFARGFEALLGVDFNCGSLLHLGLEFSAVGSDEFVVDLIEVFPAGRDRR